MTTGDQSAEGKPVSWGQPSVCGTGSGISRPNSRFHCLGFWTTASSLWRSARKATAYSSVRRSLGRTAASGRRRLPWDDDGQRWSAPAL